MISNNLKVSFRSIRKSKWFSLINIVGLTIGITCSLLIYLHISQELSFDNFHKDVDRLYRVTYTTENSTGLDHEDVVPYPMIGALKEDFTQFEVSTQIHQDDYPLIRVGDRKLTVDNAVFADSNFFDVFNFKILSGNPKKHLSQPGFVFLTEKSAERLFADQDPIGKQIRIRNQLDLEVAGILEDPPVNSHFLFDMLVSYPSFSTEYFNGLDITSWSMSANGSAYVRLKPTATVEQVESRFNDVVIKYFSEEESRKRNYYLQPLSSVHFDRKWSGDAVDTKTLWTLGIIGTFILLIGCVNFINLSTALAVKKSKEVGVRKTLGASKSQLLRQYLADTFIITFIAAILAVALCERLIPLFNYYFEASIAFSVLRDFEVLLFTLMVIVLVTFLAGLYPALILSGYNPVKALKNNIHSQDGSSVFLRKGLIVVQFFISQILIIATIVIANQMDYFISKPLGFDKEAIINVDISKNDESTLESIRTQLLANDDIKGVSFALAPPVADDTFETGFYLTEKGKTDEHGTQVKPVDFYFLETYGLKLKYGNWFSQSEEKQAFNIFKDDSEEKVRTSYVINETAAQELGFSNEADILGTYITTGAGGISGPVIGVIEDYHLGSLHDEIEPAVMMHLPMFYYDAGIKISMERSEEAIAYVKEVFERIFPDGIFEYSFMDEQIAEFYSKEQQTYNLFKVSSGLSIFISCLGLLGLISFMVTQRAKEVGIRKVLGAKMSSIIYLFSKDFMILVIVAFILSVPVAYYSMNLWLSDFAYKIGLEWWFFGAAILISGFITFLMIGFQSLKAAMENPVNALRDE